jgi:hypothetical protein
MKKNIKRFSISLFVILSIGCTFYVNRAEVEQSQVYAKYGDLAESTDRVFNNVRVATLFVEKVVDFISKRDLG